MAISTRSNKLPKGVRKTRLGYKARIEVADREYGLGTFETPQDAKSAYLGAKALRDARLAVLTAKGRSRA